MLIDVTLNDLEQPNGCRVLQMFEAPKYMMIICSRVAIKP